MQSRKIGLVFFVVFWVLLWVRALYEVAERFSSLGGFYKVANLSFLLLIPIAIWLTFRKMRNEMQSGR